MSYVVANTSNPLGRRPLGWYNGPYSVYPQPELSPTRGRIPLSGEWVPPGPPPRATQGQGMMTYRVDPATGKYRFYATDILPRGVWQHNVFQHPAPPAITPLGAVTPARGQQLVQLPSGRVTLSATSPLGCMSKCQRRGACKCKRSRRAIAGLRGLGALIDQGDGTFLDTDTGAILTADQAQGARMATEQTNPPAPGTQRTTVDLATPGSKPQTFTVAAGLPTINVNVSPQQQPSWFSGSTRIGGMVVSNMALAAGAGLIGFMAMSRKGRRR